MDEWTTNLMPENLGPKLTLSSSPASLYRLICRIHISPFPKQYLYKNGKVIIVIMNWRYYIPNESTWAVTATQIVAIEQTPTW